MAGVGVCAIVIGRNEGARLIACLEAILPQVDHVIYVDSGSSDDSVNAAQTRGAQVVHLDMSRPFNAARARNAGIAALDAMAGPCDYVMFLDGDTQVTEGWISKGLEVFAQDPARGIVTGVLRERYPEVSVYNAMADFEWRRALGDIAVCGGNMMIRRPLLTQIGGYNEEIMAGEDEALCLGVRAAGARIWREDYVMAYHDAGMTQFRQWWRRAIRSGYGFAHMNRLYKGHYRSELRRVALYAVICPVLVVLGLWWPAYAGLAALLYVGSYARIVQSLQNAGLPTATACHHALFLVISKFPNLIGIVQFAKRRIGGGALGQVIEYKS